MLVCSSCRQPVDDIRGGVCWDCACDGEARAAKRTALQHLAQAARNVLAGNFSVVRFDLGWAWERATRTGDYARGGYFDSAGINWRATTPPTQEPNQ